MTITGTGLIGNKVTEIDFGPDIIVNSSTSNGDYTVLDVNITINEASTELNDRNVSVTNSGPDGGSDALTDAFMVNASGYSKFILTEPDDSQISDKVAGESFEIKIVAADAADSPFDGFTGQVDLEFSDGSIAPITTGNFVDGVWTGNVTVTNAGTDLNIKAKNADGSGNQEGTSHDFDVSAAEASQYLVTVGNESPKAGDVVTVTAQLADEYDNPVAEEGISLNWSSTKEGSFANETDTDVNGEAIADFTTSSTPETSHKISVSDNDGNSGQSSTFTTTEAPPIKVVFTSAERTTTAGTTSDLIVIELQNDNGNATAATSDLTISLSSSDSETGVFRNQNNSADLEDDEITIREGISSISFGYQDNTAGEYTLGLEVQNSTITDDDNQGITVTPGSFNEFVWNLNFPQTNGIAFTGVNTLTATDIYSNVIKDFDASENVVTISTSGDLSEGTISGLSGDENNEIDGAGDFTDGVANLTDLGLTYTGAAGSGQIKATSGIVSDSEDLTINAGDAAKILVETENNGSGSVVGEQTITSRNSITAYAISRDESDNFVELVIDATWGLSSVTDGVEDGEEGDLNDNGDGSATFTGALVGSAVINAASGSLDETPSGTITVEAGDASKLAIATQPTGGSSGEELNPQPVIEIQDAAGNVITDDNSTEVEVSITSGDGGTLTGTEKITATAGEVEFTDLVLAGTVGENYVLTFSDVTTGRDEGDLLDAANSNNVTINAGAPANFTVSNPDPINQGDELQVNITGLQDSEGNTVADRDYDIVVGDQLTGEEFTLSDVTFTSGTASDVLVLESAATAQLSAGDFENISFTIENGSDNADVTIQQTINNSEGVTLTIGNVTINQGDALLATIENITDLAGDPFSGTADIVISALDDLDGYSDGNKTFTGETITNGEVTLEVLSGTETAELASQSNVTLTGSIGQASGDFDVTVSAVISASSSSVEVNPASVLANGESYSVVTITVNDVSSNAVSRLSETDFDLSFETGETSSAEFGNFNESGGGSDSANGIYTFRATNESVETGNVTVSVYPAGDNIALDDEPQIEFAEPVVDTGNSSISANPTELTANGTDASTLTLTVADADGVGIDGFSFGDFTFTGLSDAELDENSFESTEIRGEYTVELTNTTAEDVTISAEVGGENIGNTDEITFTPGPAASITLTGDTDALASGSNRTLTATLYDAQNNVVSTGDDSDLEITFTKNAGEGSVNGLSAETANEGVASITLEAVLAGSVTIRASTQTTAGTDIDDNLTFEIIPGDAAKLVLNQEPDELTSTEVIPEAQRPIVQLLDAAGNNVEEENVEIIASLTQGDGNLSGDESINTGPNGRAEFANLTITGTVGANYILTFEADNLDPVSTQEFDLNTGLANPTIATPADDSFVNIAGADALTVSGAAEGAENVRITITDSGSGEIEEIVAVSDDDYTNDFDVSGLAEGQLDIEVVGIDAGDNESAAVSVSVTLDLTAPVLFVEELVTNNNTPTITGTSDQPEGSEISITINGETYTGTTDIEGDWSIEVTDELPDDEYTVSATTSDEAGNETSENGTVTVDTTPPTLTINDLITHNTTPTLTGTSDEIGGEVSVAIDGETYTATVDGDGNWETEVTEALAEGDFTPEASISDEAGNTNTEQAAISIDTTAPTVDIQNAPGTVNNTDAFTVTFEFSEDVTGFTSDDISISNGSASNFNSEDATTYTADITPDGNGDITIDVATGVASDEAGNDNEVADQVEVTFDNVAPEITINDLLTADDTPTITGTSDEIGGTVTVTIDETDYTTTVNNDESWEVDVTTPLTDVEYTATASITDGAGNEATDTATITIDTNAPDGYAVTWDTDSINSENETEASFTISDGEDGADYSWEISDGTDALTGSGTLAGTEITIDNQDVSLLDDGTLTLTVAFTDEAGNEGGEVTDQVTKNTEAPRLTSIERETPTEETTNADELTFAVTFNEDVQSVSGDDFEVSGLTGSTINVDSLNPAEYEVTINGGDLADFDGTVGLSLIENPAINDVYGNALTNTDATGTTETFTLDNTTPEITDITVVGTPDDNAASIEYEVSFSENISGFNLDGFSVETTSGNATGDLDGFTGEDDTYTVTLNNVDGVGELRLDFAHADDTEITDLAANAIAEDYTGDDTYSVNIIGAIDLANSSVSVDPDELSAGATSTITTILRDGNNNPITGISEADFTFGLTGSSSFVNESFSEASDGGYVIEVTNEVAEEITTTVSVDEGEAEETEVGSDSITFTPAAANAENTTIAAAPEEITSDGTDESTVTITVRDEFSNIRTDGGDDLFIATTHGNLSAITDNNDGTYTVLLTGATMGDVTLTGYLGNDENGTEFGTANVTLISGPAAELAFVEQPTDATAGDVISPSMTVQLFDANDNEVTVDDVEITLTISDGATLVGTETQSTVNGVATFDDLYVIESGMGYSFTASSDGLDSDESDSFDITRRAITITAQNDQVKTYGDDDPIFDYEVTTGDLITDVDLVGELSRTTGEGVGDYTITQGTVDNGNNSSYNITFVDDDFTITPKELTIDGAVVQQKVYDGSNDAVIEDATLVGVNEDDDVTLADFTGTFAQSGVGTDIEVTPSFTFTGDDVENYTLTQPTGLTADITKATPDVATWPSASGIIYGETLSDSELTGGSADVGGEFTFVDGNIQPENTGTYTTDILFTPTNSDNYSTVEGTDVTDVEVDQKAIAISVNNASRAADEGDPEFSLTDFSSELANGDDQSDVIGTDATFTLASTDGDSPTGVYEDEIDVDPTSIDGGKVANYDVTVNAGDLTITPASLAEFEVTGISDPTQAGDENDVTITAIDTEGNIKTDYPGTITFSSSDEAADLPADYTFTEGDEGVITLTGGVALKTAGEQWVEVEDNDDDTKTGRQEEITVTPDDASQIAISTIGEQTVGIAFGTTFTIQDEFENTVTDFVGEIDVDVAFDTITPNTFTFVSGDNGERTTGFTLGEAGDMQRISAEFSDDASVTGQSNNFDVVPGKGALLVITTQPEGGTSGSELPTQPVVEIRDIGNNLVSTDDETDVTVSIYSGENGTLEGTKTVTATGGAVTYSDLTLAGLVEEDYVLRFTSPGLVEVKTYDFNSLSAGNLAGQDNWQLNTGSDGRSSTIETNGADGTLWTRFTQSGSGVHTVVSRVNDEAFAFTNLDGSDTKAVFQADVYVGFWGMEVWTGYDQNENGTIYGAERGPGFTVGSNGSEIGILAPGGNEVLGGYAGFSRDDWLTLKLEIDLLANDGEGEGTLYIQNLTEGATEFEVVSGLEDINLGLDQSASDGRNFTRWNGIDFDMSGATHGLNNISLGKESNIRSNDVNVTAGPAEQIAMETEPETSTSGENISGPPAVVVTDAKGNKVEGVDISVGLNKNLFSAGTTTQSSGANGIAIFDDLQIDEVDTDYILEFNADATGVDNVVSNNFAVQAGTATQLAFVEQPTDVTAGDVMDPSMTVQLLDTTGNEVTASDVEITLSISDEATLVGTETQSTVNGIATFDDLYVVESGTEYVLTASSGELDSDESNLFDVTRRAITITANNQTKVYGNDDPTFGYDVTTGDLIEDVDLTGELSRSTGDDVNVYDITQNNLTNENNPSYDITFVDGELTITPKDLTLSAFSADSKEYDGTTDVFGAEFDDNRINEDDLDFDYDVEYVDENVDTDKEINFTNIVISGGDDADNYTIVTTSGTTTADITSIDLNITELPVASNIVYGQNLSSSTLTGGESDVAGTFSFDDETITPTSADTFTADVIFTPNDTENYNSVIKQVDVEVTPKELTVADADAVDKSYDGNTDAEISGAALQGVINDDDVSLADFEGTFAQSEVGIDIEVTTSMTITGNDIENYTLAQPEGLTADINNADLDITELPAASDIVYGQSLASSILTGGESDVDGTFAFADESITPTSVETYTADVIFTPNDTENYNSVTDQVDVEVAPKELIVENAEAQNREYDGTDIAELSSATLEGLIGDDDVSLADFGQGEFVQSEVGTDIDVTTSMSITGNDAGNYTLTQPTNLSADITKRTITLTGSFGVADKPYDENTSATITDDNIELENTVTGETLTLSLVAEFATEEVGENIEVTLTIDTELEGITADNYELDLTNAPTTTAEITSASAEAISIVTQPVNTIAGESIEPSVKIVDFADNPVEGVIVEVSLNKAEFTEDSTLEVVTEQDGIADFDNLIITLADIGYELTFSVNGLTAITSTAFDVSAAGVDLTNAGTVLEVITNNVVADGNEEAEVRATLLDAFDNPVLGEDVEFSVTGNADLVDASGNTDAEGRFVTALTNKTTENVDVTAVYGAGNNSIENGSPAAIIFVTGAISAAESSVSADPENLPAGENSTVTISLLDNNSNPVAGLEESDFDLDFGDSSAEVIENSFVADEEEYTFEVTNKTAEEVSISVVADDVSLDDQPEVTFNNTGAFADNSEISADPTTLTVGEESIVTVTLRDEFSNAVSGVTNFDINPNGDATISEEITEDAEESGTYRFTITNNTAEEIDVNVAADEVEIGESAIEFLSGALSSSQSSVTVDPNSVTTGQNSTITIILRDADENRIVDISEDEFEFSLDETDALIVEDSFEENENGEYTFELTNETAEIVTVTATVMEINLDDKPEITFASDTPLAENSSADVPNGTPGEETIITITVLDQFENPVIGVADILGLSIEGVNDEAEFSEIVDNEDGTYTVSYNPEKAGTDQVTIELDGTEINDSPYTSEVQATSVDSMKLISGNEQEGRAGNQLSDSLVVQLLDEFENPVAGQTVSFSITPSPSDTDSYELSAETSDTDEEGFASTKVTLGDLPGSYVVLAEFDELEVEFELSATTDIASKIELISGDDQTQPTRSVLDDSLVVQVLDRFDNPVNNIPVYFTFNSTPEDAIDQSMNPDTVSTTSDGFAKTSVRLGSADGDYIVKAAVENDQADPVLFTMDATFTAPNPTLIDTVNTVVFNGGLNSYMYAEFDESLDQTGFTYETWILPNSLDSDGYISKRWDDDDASNSQYRFRIVGNQLTVELIDAEGEVYSVEIDDFFRVGADDNENNFMAASVAKLNNETAENIDFSWTHFAVVADPAGETISIYRDGFEIERRQLNNELQSSDQRMEVGRGFDGEVHEVRLWSIPKTPREIQAFKDLILTGEEENLVLYHSFDEDNENMSPDATNFNNDFYFTDEITRNRSLRNVTRVTVNQDSDFAVRLAALDATGGTVDAEVTELPENGQLFQLDGAIQPTDEITEKKTTLTDQFNRSLYVPERDFAGVDSIRYRMYDQYGNFSTATLIFEVLEVNRPPMVDPVISKVQFPQREVFEVQLDTVVTDNVYSPEEMDWEIRFTDDRFDWNISSDGVEKELNKEQATKEEWERWKKERILINDRKPLNNQRSGERTELGSNPEVFRADQPVAENEIDQFEDFLDGQGMDTDNLSPDQIKELLDELNMANEEEQRLIVEYNETERLLRFTTTPLFYDEDISMQVTATDPEGLHGRRDLLVTVDYRNDPPTDVSLLFPANLDSVHANTVQFEWSESTSIEEDDIFYTLIIERQDGEQLLIEELTDTTYAFTEKSDFFIEDFNYDWHVIATDKIDETRSVDDFNFLTIQSVPFVYSLQNNYPNPFNPTTKVEYWIPVRSDVRLEIYDVIGRRVQVLVNETGVTPGTYTADFNGRGLASGVYFYRLTAQGENGSQFHRVKQMTLIK
ncbi:MAG: YDG domain-containing protein [Balneolaceae bacterium]